MQQQDRYLVSITPPGSPGARRQVIWEGQSALLLGRSDSWRLERFEGGLRLSLPGYERELAQELFYGDQSLELPLEEGGCTTHLSLKKVPRLSAAYLPVPPLTADDGVRARLRISSGTQGLFSGFRDVSRKSVGRAGLRPVFVIRKRKSGYELKARTDDVRVCFEGVHPRQLNKKESVFLTDHQAGTLSLAWGLHWWRLGRIAERELVTLARGEPSQSELEVCFCFWCLGSKFTMPWIHPKRSQRRL